MAWQGGQEAGNSVADILIGKVNPSGKLPMTFPIKLSDHASNSNFPKNPKMWSLEGMIKNMIFPPNERPDAKKIKDEDYTYYDEGIYIGYRHFDKSDLNVSYPFGYGLSYTDFKYESMNVEVKNDTINIEITIKNIGSVPGKEIIQFYTEKLNSEIDRPIQELKAFIKTKIIEPNSVERASIQIPISELRYWNEANNDWSLERGTYLVKSGMSSRDIKLISNINL